MDSALVDVFEQARQVVADADRKVAEEEQRRREGEREILLAQLGERIEDAFDFTSKEKLELEPRLDVQDGVAVVEFVVRSLRAIFLLTPGEGNTWTLRVIEDDRGPQVLSEFQGGTKAEQGSRRLASARIVTAVGNWSKTSRDTTLFRTRINHRHRRDCTTETCQSPSPPTEPWASFSVLEDNFLRPNRHCSLHPITSSGSSGTSSCRRVDRNQRTSQAWNVDTEYHS